VRKSILRTALFVTLGAVAGTVAGQLLAEQVPLLKHQTVVSWSPSADLSFVRYSLNIVFRVNWLTLIGAVSGFFLERKVK